MSARQVPRITPEAYLAADRAAAFTSEYVDGAVFAMSGGSVKHARLKFELGVELRSALGSKKCDVTSGDLRVQIAPEGAYFYPDVMIFCGRNPGDADDIVSNPMLVAEVLSPSTERWDRVGKFAEYRRVATLREYLLVSQEEPRIEWFTRMTDGRWAYQEAHGLDAVCYLEGLEISISLARIYEGILPPPSQES